MALFSTAHGESCEQPEARFKGKVVKLEIYHDDYAQIGTCNFMLEIAPDDFQTENSEGCVLNYEEVIRTTFSYEFYRNRNLTSCPVRYEGQSLIGNLIQIIGTITIE